MQAYSNPSRETAPYSLPDVEVFYHEHMKRELCALNAGHMTNRGGECIVDSEGDCLGTGWYWWTCLPGCLPDSDPVGPFSTEDEALADAQDTDDYDDTPEDHSCDQCQAVMINGVYCHETGCPNTHKVKVDGEWITPDNDNEESDE